PQEDGTTETQRHREDRQEREKELVFSFFFLRSRFLPSLCLCVSVVPSSYDRNTSSTAPPVSTIFSGRPTLLSFSSRGLMPSARQKVQNKSGTDTGRSDTSTPPLSVAPTTRPPRTPAPASARLNACG